MLTSCLWLAILSGSTPSEDGAELLLQAARQLQTDRAVSDTLTLETTTRGTAVSIRCNLVMGQAVSGTLSRGTVTAVISDDWASVTHAHKPELYFVAEANEDSVGQLLGLLNSPAALLPHFALRLAEDAEMAVSAFARSWEDEVSVQRSGTCELDGRQFREVVLNHAEGRERILIDPDNHRIVKRIADRDGHRLTLTHQWAISDAPARPLEFEAGDRKLAPELLSVLTASPGDTAPLFEVATLGGTTQSLQEALKDSVVVLDFWATWCRPCIKGLKKVQGFVSLAEAEGLKVQVFAVNVSERLEGEQRLEAVRSFWNKTGYTYPVLLDPDDSVRQAYGAAEIPLTLVIDQRGQITAVHEEADGELVNWLKTSSAAAMRRPR